MIFKILKRDLLKKKVIISAVFIFIMISALLMAGGSRMIIELNNSLDYLFEKSSAPHFVQYHSGQIDQQEIESWSANNALVKREQTGAMLNIDGTKIFINNQSEKDTVMEMAFVKQNESFDYLLDLNNRPIELKTGEIAVPIYYLQKRDLEIGDSITIKDSENEYNFVIKNFVRDVQMNPSIVSSKRFVVSDSDFEKLRNSFGELEYLISFQLNNLADLNEFSRQYNSSDLPQKGPTIDIELLRLLNSLTDGLVAAVLIMISILLNIIALLCLRFIIILTIEEDYKDIGVMKAVGINKKDVKKIYLSKYIFISFTAALAGYLLSIFISRVFSQNIMLYIGTAPKTLLELALVFGAALSTAVITALFSLFILRRMDKVSAVEAMRFGSKANAVADKSKYSLYKNRLIPAEVFLGLRDVLIRYKLYTVLFIVFILSTFIIIVPMNFLNTLNSPGLISYMGMAESDIIIDLRQSDNIRERFENMKDYLEKDEDVKKYAPYVTSKFEIINQEGYAESIFLESGDFTVFPSDYLKGSAPLLQNEIALSYLSSEEMDKEVGDQVELLVDGERRQMIVTGIYQDITNGGRTAKANITPNYETASWYNINVNVEGDIQKKLLEFENNFDEAKVTDIRGYFDQTFGNTVDQLTLLTISAVIIALLVTVLITSLFLKMLIAKDRSQIAVKKAVGISEKKIKTEYLSKALLVLITAIIIGTLTANTLGEKVVSLALSLIGASQIEFVINPIQAYLLTPLLMMGLVVFSALYSIRSIREFSVADINLE